MEKLPVPLVCITLEHIIDDPVAVEGLMQSDQSAVETCIPIIMRRMLGPSAARANLSPNILTPGMLLHVLQVFWTPIDDKDPYIRQDKMLRHAVELGASYLVPYLLELLPPPPYGDQVQDYPLVTIMKIAARNPDLKASMDMVRTIQRTISGIGLGGRMEIWHGLLGFAAAYGNADVVDFVIQKTTRDGKTALTTAILTHALEIASKARPELFQTRANEFERLATTLMQNGADPLAQGSMENAARKGNIGIIRAFIRQNPEMLHYPGISHIFGPATSSGHTEIAEFLLDAGMDPNVNNDWPLFSTVSANNLPLTRRLLMAGADIHSNYEQPLKVALQNGYHDMIRLLLDNGADPFALQGDLSRGYVSPTYVISLEIIRKFVEKLPGNDALLKEINDVISSAHII